MSNKYPIPSMDNYTPEALIELIAGERENQKRAKFYEGLYRQRLDATRDPAQPAIESDNFIGNYRVSQQERIDTEAVRAAFSRDELIQRGFLKVTDITTLNINPRPQPVQNLRP